MLASCGRKTEVSDIYVIPQPVFVSQKSGFFTLQHNIRIHLENLGQNAPTAKYWAKSLRKLHFHPTFNGKSSGNDLVLRINDSINQELGDEGYLIEIRAEGIDVSANTEAGLFYAFQTLKQVLPSDAAAVLYSKIKIPCTTILDYPRFAWRGSQLDVCTHFYTVKQIKRHLDLMAAHKLNKFHWHLSDDYGWRIQIDAYPELTEVGAWRPSRENVPWYESAPPKANEKSDYGGFYTKKDIAEILAYAEDRHIEVIPEISIPSHCSPILAAYPQYSCDGGEYLVQVGPYWPAKAILCAGNDSVLSFIKHVMNEVVEMFPSQYIHIGATEGVFDNWSECPHCQQRMRQLHLESEVHLQYWLVSQVQQYLDSLGRIVIGWESMQENPSLNHSALVMAWKDVNSGVQIAQQGFQVIMCPSDFTNLDYYQAAPATQPTAMGRENTLRHTYEFDPCPMGVNSYLAANIIGGQCNTSSEFITNTEELDYMTLPRLCAIAECLWSPRESRDWFSFRRRMVSHRKRLITNGYNPCPGSFKPLMHRVSLGNGYYKVALQTEVANTYVFYTTDGTTPTSDSKIYIDPIVVPAGTLIKTQSFFEGQPREDVYEFQL